MIATIKRTLLTGLLLITLLSCSTPPTSMTTDEPVIQVQETVIDGVSYPTEEVTIDKPAGVNPVVAEVTVYRNDTKRDVLVKIGSPEKRVLIDGREGWLYWDGMLIVFDNDSVFKMLLLSVSL